MSDVVPVDPQWAKSSHCDNAKYLAMYERSVKDPDGFWAEMAERLDWIKKPTRIKNTSFEGDVSIRWYEDGELNVCYNCVDRHLAKRGDQVAIICGGRRPRGRPEDHLPRAAREGLPARQRAEGHGRQEGRPGHHLPADDPRGRLRHAGLRPDRRGALGGVRRLLARQPRRPGQRRRSPSWSSPPTAACAAAAPCRSRRTPTRRWRSARPTSRC